MEDYCYSSVEEYYHPRKEGDEILSAAAYLMVKKRFETQKGFADFHKASDRYFFYDMPEDEFVRRVEIAREILGDMECELNLSAKEILDYTKTRNKFEAELRDFLKVSLRAAKEIRKEIENKL